MPDLTSTTHLKDLIGADSHTLLKLLSAASNFNDLHPKTWSPNADFVAVKAMIENLPAINDAAERALALVTNICFSPTAPKLHRTKKRSDNCAPFMSPEVKEARATAAT